MHDFKTGLSRGDIKRKSVGKVGDSRLGNLPKKIHQRNKPITVARGKVGVGLGVGGWRGWSGGREGGRLEKPTFLGLPWLWWRRVLNQLLRNPRIRGRKIQDVHVHVHIGRRRVVGGRESVCGHGKTIGLFVVYELRLAGIRLSLLDSGSK